MTEETKAAVLETVLRIGERLGVPVLVLAVVIWLAREAAVSAHRTVVQPIVAAHVEFLGKTEQTLARQAETLQEIAAGQQEIREALLKGQN
jgi:hypothetical protein